MNCHQISSSSFESRRQFLVKAFEEGAYLKDGPASKDAPATPNIMTDPAAMEGMMDGMKKNMAMFIPQTLIMSWVTFFFSGFVSRGCLLDSFRVQRELIATHSPLPSQIAFSAHLEIQIYAAKRNRDS
jgi:hypothetical protein